MEGAHATAARLKGVITDCPCTPPEPVFPMKAAGRSTPRAVGSAVCVGKQQFDGYLPDLR